MFGINETANLNYPYYLRHLGPNPWPFHEIFFLSPEEPLAHYRRMAESAAEDRARPMRRAASALSLTAVGMNAGRFRIKKDSPSRLIANGNQDNCRIERPHAARTLDSPRGIKI